MGGAGVEHQDSRRRGVPGEYVEHAPLIVWPQMKEAVPCQNAIKPAGKLHRPHVPYQPVVTREALTAQRDKGWGCIDAGHVKSAFSQMLGDRRA
jgi:hypothetical protein